MKRFLLILFSICFLASSVQAWDGPWDIDPVPYVKKTAAPTVNDDSFIVPYMWVDETNDKVYILIDNTPGAAIWQEVIYAGGSPSFATVDLTGVTDGNIPYMQTAGAGFGDSPLSRSSATAVDLNSTMNITDGTDTSIIKAVQEPGLGGRLTVGLDETARTMVICDAGDVDTDFGLAVVSEPRLYIYSSDGSKVSYIENSNISIRGGRFISATTNTETTFTSLAFIFNSYSDLAADNMFKFTSAANIELTDTDGEQSWLYVEPKINQSSTAAYNGLKILVTETALGDGSTGTGGTNNLIVAGTASDPDMFKVDNSGNTTVAGTLHAVGAITSDAGCCADYVFAPDYKLPTIDEVDAHVAEVGHLPGMSAATGTEKKSLDLIKAIMELTVKVEEQSLYISQLHKRIKELEEN